MPEPIYVPILKGKEGEYAALEYLYPDLKALIMPLIEVPAIPYDFASEAPAKSLDEHISNIPGKLHRACGAMPFYLDVPWFGEEERIANGKTALETILTALADFDSAPVPVVYRDSSSALKAAAGTYSASTGSGVCVRLLVEDFEDDIDLEGEVARLLAIVAPDDAPADLIIDLEDLGSKAGTASLVARSVFSMLPCKARWRRMILAAASFPEDLSDVSAATVVTLPRLEWDLWKYLQKKRSSLPRPELIFADYAMAHPVGKSLDPRTMRMSANIRYTTKDNWLVIKGRNVKQYGFGQYFELSRLLVERPEYSGRAYSWGDTYIGDCADATQGPGNATTWRKVGVNHHITLVARGLANLTVSV